MSLRERKNKKSVTKEDKLSSASSPGPTASSSCYLKVNLVLTVLALATRFWRLYYPNEVVFDEVHFGKFASYYLERTYFFDLHPPFAKLLIAAVGYLAGYDGKFKFDNIGDKYLEHNVPYVTYRSLSAVLGSATVPVVFWTLQETGFSVAACALGASLVLFDNAHISETRLILLDATLIFFVALSMLTYVKFRQQRKQPFTAKWWAWLAATGVSLASVISTKYVGAFTFATIGAAVLPDLYRIADIRYGNSVRVVARHFFARVLYLIAVPFVIFLFWFYIHFQVLSNSGPGDAFMSPAFQATLKENPVAKEALDVYFYDTVTLKSKPLGQLLHSHAERYPLQYDDGRISSQGQQVTGYTHEDLNNQWQILPAMDFPADKQRGMVLAGSQPVRLRHIATDTFLFTHDVASPSFPTNEEFTTVSAEDAAGDKYNGTLFELQLQDDPNQLVRTKLSLFKLRHVLTDVYMFISENKLPEWGFGQFEVNGAKDKTSPATVWSFDSIVGLDDPTARKHDAESEVEARRPFWTDYVELQGTMFRSNNNLKTEHPYGSSPIQWPFLTRGVSFWTKTDDKSQIYFVGNFAGYAIEIFGIVAFVATALGDQLCLLRGINVFSPYKRTKLYGTVMWFFGAWALHYLPFFLMGRQLFLHHYLPAHLLAALLTAGIADVLLAGGETRSAAKSSKLINFFTLLCITAIVFMFFYWAPLTYGLPMTPEQIQKRQWNDISLHFNR